MTSAFGPVKLFFSIDCRVDGNLLSAALSDNENKLLVLLLSLYTVADHNLHLGEVSPSSKMTDITPDFNIGLKAREATPVLAHRYSIDRLDEFLKEAYNIVSSMRAHPMDCS